MNTDLNSSSMSDREVLIISVIRFTIILVLAYLLFAFGLMNYNVAQWSEVSRFSLIGLTLATTVFITIKQRNG